MKNEVDEEMISQGVKKGMLSYDVAQMGYGTIVKESLILSIICAIAITVNTGGTFSSGIGIAMASFCIITVLWFIPIIGILMAVACSIIWGLAIGSIASYFLSAAGIIVGIFAFLISMSAHFSAIR